MKKYTKIIVLLSIIILFNIGVAIGSFLISDRISRFDAYTDALGSEQIALHKMSQSIIDINLYADRYNYLKKNNLQQFWNDTYYQTTNIKGYFVTLGQNIRSFKDGGLIITRSGHWNIEKPKGRAKVLNQRISEIWVPMATMIENLAHEIDDQNIQSIYTSSRFSADYVRRYGSLLDGYLGELRIIYQGHVDYWSHILHLVQIISILVTATLFLILIFWELRSLIHLDEKVAQARKEVSDIMRTVKEGLFLVNRDLIISGQYSAALEGMLGQHNIAGRHLDDLLANIISEQNQETTRDYIEQLFNDAVIEELVYQLNPLDKVEIYLQSHLNPADTELRYISFAFTRVYDKEGLITSVLISATDITERVHLEERLEKARAVHDEQIELLSTILNIPEDSLLGFLRNAHAACDAINEVFKDPRSSHSELVDKLNRIFREVHGMKGEASALALEEFVVIIQAMEARIATLKEKRDLNGQDFLSLTLELEKAINELNRIEQISQRLGKRLPVVKSETNSGEDTQGEDSAAAADKRQLVRLVQEVAKRNHKQVRLLVDGWENTFAANNQRKQDKLREVVIQLLRNAVVHGIEYSEIRTERHKDKVGRVSVEVQKQNGNLVITVTDDGGGIDFQKLRDKALRTGFISSTDEPKVVRQKLIQFLFSSGVSTLEQKNEDAGCGVGLDVARYRIQEMGGTISMATKAERSTSFRIVVPL